MYGVLAAMVLAASPDSVEQAFDEAPIEAVRFHGEASVLFGVGFSGIPSIGLGPGVHLEIGPVFGGDSVVSARVSFATVGLFSVMQFGASYAHLIDERFSLGVGLTWGGVLGCCDIPSSLSVQVPLRVTWRVFGLTRRGLTLGFDVAPGIVYLGGGFFLRGVTVPNISVLAGLSVGYAVW